VLLHVEIAVLAHSLSKKLAIQIHK
jgi:hypothetical protein